MAQKSTNKRSVYTNHEHGEAGFQGLLHNFSRSEANDHFRRFLGSFAANSGDYLTKMPVKMGKMSVAAVA